MERFLRPLYRLGKGFVIAVFIVFYILCGLATLAIVPALIFTLNEYSIIPGIALLILGIFLYTRTREELRTRRLAQGTVTNIFEAPDEVTRYSIHYKTRQGQLTIVKTLFGGKVNSSVLLLYNPEQLSDVRKFSFSSLWLPCILICWFGFLFVIAGIFIWLSR